MKTHQIKFKNNNQDYSIFIGNNILKTLSQKIKVVCPKTKKIAIIFDKNVPLKFKRNLFAILAKYNLTTFNFKANEKSKSLYTVSFFLNKLLSKNFNRSDLVIAVGGGITGDLTGFVASIFKRGINFINEIGRAHV